MKDAWSSGAVNAAEEKRTIKGGPSRIAMDQGMARSKAYATEEHRDRRIEVRERHHSSMKGARSSGEQAVAGQVAAKQEIEGAR